MAGILPSRDIRRRRRHKPGEIGHNCPMGPRTTLAARQMAVLFVVAGVLSFAAMAEHDVPRDRFALVGLAALASALLAVGLPWVGTDHRTVPPASTWRPRADLVLIVPAYGLIGAAEATGLLP